MTVETLKLEAPGLYWRFAVCGRDMFKRQRRRDMPSKSIPSSHSVTSTHSSTNRHLAFTLMSHTHSTTASSSSSSPNFQLIINKALDTHKKRTGKDLRAHPLTAQLQACDTPGAILAVLQPQVQALDQSRNADEQCAKWLDPTINVIYTFSNIIGAGVGLVCSGTLV